VKSLASLVTLVRSAGPSVGVAVAVLVLGGDATAQDVPPRPADAPTPDLVLGPSALDPPSPGGAFLRSLAIPGWGHAAIGSYGRGAFYVAAETGTWYALIRTRLRLDEARERASSRERILRAALEREGVTDPLEVQQRVDADPALQDVQGLVESRESQQEDWVALGIFLMLLSGADAYVSAHLANFPDPIEVGVVPGVAGGVELAFRVPMGGR
jgi:hypothetical protein